MPTGDPICSECGNWLALCFGHANTLDKFLPFTSINKPAINALIDIIEMDACSCDPMAGWSCNIHDKIFQLRDMINNPIKVGAN